MASNSADGVLPTLLHLPTELLFEIAIEAYHSESHNVMILPSGRLLPNGLLHVCRKLRYDLLDHFSSGTPTSATSLTA